jgi:hypothetical protein
VYNTRAAIASAARADLTSATPDNAEASHEELSIAQVSRLTIQRQASAIQACCDHHAWKSGLGLASYDRSLRSELVDEVRTASEVSEIIEGLVVGSKVKHDNPKEKVKHCRVCAVLHGGLCCKDLYGCLATSSGTV